MYPALCCVLRTLCVGRYRRIQHKLQFSGRMSVRFSSGGTGCKSLRPDATDVDRRSLHGNPAPSAIPPFTASSNVSCHMLPFSRRPAVAKPHLPSPSCLRLLTSFLPMTRRSLRTPSPAFPPLCYLPDTPPTQAFLLTTSRSPRIYVLVQWTFPDSLPFYSLHSDPIVYPAVSGGRSPTLSRFTLVLP